MRTKIYATHHGVVEVECGGSGIPCMRLLLLHAPRMGIQCLKGDESIIIHLEDLDLDHTRLTRLNIDLSPSFSHEINIDRAQLAKLGG